MEQTPNEEFKMEPRRRKARKENPVARVLVRVLDYFKENSRWYFDIRLWSPLLVLVLLLAMCTGRSAKRAEQTNPEETVAVETQPQEEVTEPTAPPVNAEAAALARLADSVGSGRSDNVKTIIMWVAINRSEDRSNGYGQSLLDEIARPNQWQGYDENAAYSEHTYEIALSVLETQATGGLRPLDTDMLWLVLNDDGSVTLRNQFTSTGNQKWREKTVK